MGDNEAKARQKLEEAKNKSNKITGFFSSFLNPGRSNADACELYIQAGNLFKIAKNWNEAGNAFVKAAEMYANQDDSKHDAASQYSEAGNCYRKTDAQKAVDCYRRTAEIYTDMGRFNMAAKTHSTIGELYETETHDKEKCIAEYQKAADFFKGEESKSSATKCLLKVAENAAELEQYRKAVELFEEIAVWEADHPTLKYSAKTHFFQALLCAFCIEVDEADLALRRYLDISPSFAETRECKFVKELIESKTAEKLDDFTQAVQNYDKISRLDKWYTFVLTKIKKTFRETAEMEEDGDEEEDFR